WGTLTLNALSVNRATDSAGPTYAGFVSAVDIRLNLDHGGLPAGTEIQIGYAEVSAHVLPPAATTETTTTAARTTTAPTTQAATTTDTTTTPSKPPAAPNPHSTPQPKPETTPKPTKTKPPPEEDENVPPPKPTLPPGLFPIPQELTPALEGGPYVFPVFGG